MQRRVEILKGVELESYRTGACVDRITVREPLERLQFKFFFCLSPSLAGSKNIATMHPMDTHTIPGFNIFSFFS